MNEPDVGRQTDARTQGGGYSAHIPRLHRFNKFTYTPQVLSSGVATEKPFYCYRASIVVLRGLCDYPPVARALEKEELYPVRAPGGQAIAAVWINQLHDTVIGPYHEIVISFDTARSPEVPAEFRPGSARGLLYPFFGGNCINFLHTLYITSPLSIQWGREMQAFPKHRDPAEIAIHFGDRMHFDVRWGDKFLLGGSWRNCWGPMAMAQEVLGLVGNFGMLRVLSFLSAPVISLPIQMPLSVRREYGVRWGHTGHILKGLNPLGIRSWAWGKGDQFMLGTGRQAEAGPGQESPTDLLAEAGFEPQVVVHMPSLQMVVTDKIADVLEV